jgi:serine/threonine-protein phosphatase 2A regulatory subunit B''
MTTLTDRLRAYNEQHPVPTKDVAAQEAEIRDHLLRIYAEIDREESKAEPSVQEIPRFFFKKRFDGNSLQAKIRKRAQQEFFWHKHEELLGDRLQELYKVARAHTHVDYVEFKHLGRPFVGTEYFKAATFLKFDRDRHGRIEVAAFLAYVVRREELMHNRLHLSCYDTDQDGFLTLFDLKDYVQDVVHSLPQLENFEGFDEQFLPFYTLTAVSKFFFFLDPQHKQKIRIRDLACSFEFAELSELRQQDFLPAEELDGPCFGGNWFSPQFAMDLYRYYLQLDVDRNGLLSKAELREFGRPREDGHNGVFPVPTCALTDVFIDRVFEDCPLLYDGEMDFKTFVDFTIAMVYKHTPEALHYFFRLLDVQNSGRLTAFGINFFFREVRLSPAGWSPVV